MKMASHNPILGRGVYRLAEAARYTELPAGTARSWFKSRSDGAGRGPVFESDYRVVRGDFALSFHDLVDLLVAGQLRREGVSLRVIRAAHRLLSKRLETQHPFCHSDLYTDGKRVFTVTADELKDDVLSDVVSRQMLFTHVRDRLTHVDYSHVTRLADRWRIAAGVVIDPRISMGKPVIESTGVTTYVLANAHAANYQDAALVADLYAVTERDVMNAVDFERRYGVRQAA